jgi:lipoprotein-anchoring transpeptidase ErfK/SrfK
MKIKQLGIVLSACLTLLYGAGSLADADLDWQIHGLDAPTVREYTFSPDSPQLFTEPQATVGAAPDYTTLPRRIVPLGEKAFIFSPKLQRWAAYDQYGYKVAGGIGNGGADFCAELNEPCRTPIGEFRITRKKGADCESSQFPVGEGGSPMPFCSFFKGGYAIHGSPYISTQNTSHGCIRVYTAAAEWLSNYFLTKGTKVITLPY